MRAEMERRNAEAEAREANLAHLAALAALAAAKAAVTTWSKVREVEWGSAQACVGEGWRTA